MARRNAYPESKQPPGTLAELLSAWGGLFVAVNLILDTLVVIALFTDRPQFSALLGLAYGAGGLMLSATLPMKEPKSWLIDASAGALTLTLAILALAIHGPGVTTFLWDTKSGSTFPLHFPRSALLYTAVPLASLRLAAGLICFALSSHPRTASTFRTTLAIRRQKAMRKVKKK